MRAPASKANQGITVPDVVAVGDDKETQSGWLDKRNIKREQRIHLTKLSHMRYQHEDLEELHKFMLDFGMEIARETGDEIWYKGYGPDQYVYYARQGPRKFLGGTFEVREYSDLEKASCLPGASSIEELKDAPGGGFLVTITDPEGFPFNLIYGQKPHVEGQSYPENVTLNFPAVKSRFREFNRFQPGPAAVHKLGHFGYSTQRFEEQLEFYTAHFNIVPTDLLYVKDGEQKHIVTMFAHLDLGEAHTDHHSFFLSSNPPSGHVHHCSFEIHDFDTQQLGHQWLAEKGHKSVWGIGRHILGSQIFDYWWDPSGNMVEHYADGDLVNQNTPIGYVEAGHESLAVWGPEVPAAFLS